MVQPLIPPPDKITFSGGGMSTFRHPSEDGATLSVKRRRLDRALAEALPRKRRRGGQSGLSQLNFDELYIIFAYIYPMDLLNLARTCKSLRGILMHKSSAFLWRTALRRIEGLPSCPPELSEPEYTDLVFSTRCHGCGKSAKTILWYIRRRYCSSCRVERLVNRIFCDEIVRLNEVLPTEWLTIGDVAGRWVDRDQLDSFMRGYISSSHKTLFLDEKRTEYCTIFSHARECHSWQSAKGHVYRYDLDVLRRERQESIFERLRHHGYAPEIAYYGEDRIKKTCRPIFKKHKRLTNIEWNEIWREWVRIMDNFRSLRLEMSFHRPRRSLLMSKYDKYVTYPSPDSPTPTLEIFPHVVDLLRFPFFRDIIEVSEGAQPDDILFASAFTQLSTLVANWVQKLKSDIAELIQIPSRLFLANVARDQDQVSRSTKLDLACAVFCVGSTGAFPYPEILSVSMLHESKPPTHTISADGITKLVHKYICPDYQERTGAIHERFGFQFLEEAPYIIHACGLDPSVATPDDMDRRNARLSCLYCGGRTLIMNWRHAIWHACFYHCISTDQEPLSELPRWELVDDGYIDAIQAVERSVQKAFPPDWSQCLLCRPCVGDAMLYDQMMTHLIRCHNLVRSGIREEVHYKLIGIRDICVVEMDRMGEQVSFKALEEYRGA